MHDHKFFHRVATCGIPFQNLLNMCRKFRVVAVVKIFQQTSFQSAESNKQNEGNGVN